MKVSGAVLKTIDVPWSLAGVPALLACALALNLACGSGDRRPGITAEPSVTPSPTPSPQAGREISVGQEIADTLVGHGAQIVYELTAPFDGTLLVRLAWDPHQGLLALRVGDIPFATASSPLIARIRVAAGQKYLVRVLDGIPWDYDDLRLPFVLTTSIE